MSYISKISTFSSGFAAGISGLVNFASPAHIPQTPSSDELIARAWRGVGTSIWKSMAEYDKQNSVSVKRKP